MLFVSYDSSLFALRPQLGHILEALALGFGDELPYEDDRHEAEGGVD